MPGILALLGKVKPAEKDTGLPSEGGASASGGGAERMYAQEAFTALKDDDQEGFIEAFIGAVKACVAKAKDDGYGDDDELPAE